MDGALIQRFTKDRPHRTITTIKAVFVSLVVLQSSCQTTRPPLTPVNLAVSLPGDQQAIKSIESHNAELRSSFLALRDSGNWKKIGYFSAEESDRTEMLLFRFHTAHHHLNDIVERYETVSKDDANAKKAAALKTDANRLAHQQSEFIVSTFAGDKIAINKLNQAFPRSEIPINTYSHLAESVERRGKRASRPPSSSSKTIRTTPTTRRRKSCSIM